ncbi:hypothetical protein [Falsirhodobacter sp. alg1]|uniref:hypothetical protein n=1 Tax=Falsirhodobacter sp. alg1 TaxID=1472418 RepID=UPI0005EED75E|nr:hypothetical protein [Falsirhodobacter sp. alg1]
MKTFALTAATAVILAVTGAASAQTAAPGDKPLSSGAVEQLRSLKPELDLKSLTPIQVNEINREVETDGLTDSELIDILETM